MSAFSKKTVESIQGVISAAKNYHSTDSLKLAAIGQDVILRVQKFEDLAFKIDPKLVEDLSEEPSRESVLP